MNDIDKIWRAVESYPSNYQPDVEEGLERFKKRIKAERTGKIRVLWRPAFSVAAAVLVLVAIGLWWQNFAYTGSGSITTNSGEIATITLPDGTEVTLNKNSTLTYDWSDRFQATRSVHFRGEGYFQVRKQANRPFAITTPMTRVEVLGTAFNLKNYAENEIAIVEVNEGSVAFKERNSSEQIIVLPHEQGICDPQNSKGIDKVSVRNLNAHSWMTKELSFRNTPLQEIIDDLEKHYNVQIEILNDALATCKYTTHFKNDSIEQVLQVLQASFGLSVRQADTPNHYQLIGGSCER